METLKSNNKSNTSEFLIEKFRNLLSSIALNTKQTPNSDLINSQVKK